VVEAVHSLNRCRCLFATHYHELSRLAETCDALSLHHVRAREWQASWCCSTNWPRGLPTAAMASPSRASPVCRRRSSPGPKAVLDKLEKGRAATGGMAAGSTICRCSPPALAAEPEVRDALRDRLGALEIDALSPRDALGLLYELQRLAAE
jgi:DNA mismatch repair protein MutS